MRWLSIAALALVSQLWTGASSAQSMLPAELGNGKILVASRDLPDPNFSKTVVLLVKYDDDGVLGLILNRRSKVPVSRALDDVGAAKDRADLIYAGGPVGSSTMLVLLRSRNKPGDAEKVFGDIYLVSTKELLEKTFSAGTDADRLRVYMGYAGWTIDQLEHEVDLKAWYIFRGDARAVFDSDPDTLWSRLIQETELRIASAR